MAELSAAHNTLNLIATAFAHPHGHEIVGMIYEISKSQPKAQPNPRLVAIAVQVSKTLEPHKVPYFKAMTDEDIQNWITQNS